VIVSSASAAAPSATARESGAPSSRRSLGAALAAACSALDTRGRLEAALIAALGVVERGVVVAGAFALTGGSRAVAVGSAVVLASAWSARAALRGSLRVRLQRRFHRLAAAALLGADPLVTTPLDADPETILLEGVHHGSTLVGERLPGLAADTLSAAGILVVLLATQPAPTLVVALAGLAFAATAGLVLRRATARAGDAAWAAYRPLLERMLVAIRGRVEIVANGAEERFTRDLDARLERFQRETGRADRLAGLVGRAPLAAAVVGVGCALVAVGDGVLGRTAAVLDAALLASVAAAFLGIVRNGHESYKGALSFRPMAALLSLPAAAGAGGASSAARSGREEHSGGSAPRVLALEGVDYRYPGSSRAALTGMTLSLASGRPLVLRGPNGAGKSTVLRLLASLGAPSVGRVTVDGVDLASLEPARWRSGIAYLPQTPLLPEALPVAEAMRLFAVDASDEALRSALAEVGLLPILIGRCAAAPLGVRIGELSVGQRKRVAIARVLLARDATVLLLDEPDAALDEDGVTLLGRALRRVAEHRLVAVAAHDPRLVELAGGVELVLESVSGDRDPGASGPERVAALRS